MAVSVRPSMQPQDSDLASTEESDFTLTLETEHFAYLLSAQITPASPICVATAKDRTTTTSVPKDIREFEIWHQRMGHAPAKRLYLTAQHTKGLPRISPTSIPSLVRCRACDIAKLKKANKGKSEVTDVQILPGQQFNMDLGVIRGPSNLQAVVDRLEEPKPNVIHSLAKALPATC